MCDCIPSSRPRLVGKKLTGAVAAIDVLPVPVTLLLAVVPAAPPFAPAVIGAAIGVLAIGVSVVLPLAAFDPVGVSAAADLVGVALGVIVGVLVRVTVAVAVGVRVGVTVAVMVAVTVDAALLVVADVAAVAAVVVVGLTVLAMRVIRHAEVRT